MFKHILVPLDRSRLAEQALGTAAALAHTSHGEVSLVLAHRLAPYDGVLAASWEDAKDPEESIYIRKIAEELARGASVPVNGTVAGGIPVEVITRRAHEIGADLIVMTSHGRTGFNRAWLGSVTDAVVRSASVPVLMLRASEDRVAHGEPSPSFQRILVPIDGSTTSSAILDAAIRMAKCSGGRIVLARVVVPVVLSVFDAGVPAYPTAILDPDETNHLADIARDDLSALATQLEREHGVTCETCVEIGTGVAEQILGLARAHEADLIAMTTHGRGASRLLVGSVTDKVLRGGHLPLLLYHPIVARVADVPGQVPAAAGMSPALAPA